MDDGGTPVPHPGHGACRRRDVRPPDRRKLTRMPTVDRRKSYIDIMERVLGSSYLPDSAPPILHLADTDVTGGTAVTSPPHIKRKLSQR